jgi:enolase
LDQIKPVGAAAKEAPKIAGQMLTAYLEAEKKYKTPQPSFRFEQALDILIMAHDGFGVKLNREGALCLLKRATKTSPDGSGLTFTRDLRLNALLGQRATPEQLADFYANMSCEMLIILGKDGINDLNNPDIRTVYEGHKRTAKNFKCITIDGDHFVHLTNPEKAAKLIEEYINESQLSDKVSAASLN